MLDALYLIGLMVFFGLLIYSIVTKKSHVHIGESGVNLMEARMSVAPSPVGLYCSICGEHADVVSSEEYARLSAAGHPVYCHWCMITIEAYKQQAARR